MEEAKLKPVKLVAVERRVDWMAEKKG